MTLPIYNPETAHLIALTRKNLPQALLLEGPIGIGLRTAAMSIAGSAVTVLVEPTNNEGSPDASSRGVIRIARIRELAIQTRSKLTEQHVFIIDEADKMNQQAQNGFLKMLEEPVPHVCFILTAHAPHKLLSTIISRVQRLRLLPVSTDESTHLIHAQGVTDNRTIQQLLFLADGRPAELCRLLNQPKILGEQTTIMSDARAFMQSGAYTKSIIVMRYASDRSKALALLESLQSIIRFSLLKKPSQELIETADRLACAYDRIAANGNVRLQLMSLVV